MLNELYSQLKEFGVRTKATVNTEEWIIHGIKAIVILGTRKNTIVSIKYQEI